MASTRNSNSAPPLTVVTPDNARSEGPSPRAERTAKLEAWKACRKNLLPIIASNLSEAIHDEWVIASKLLPTQLLPATVPLVSFTKAFWFGSPDFESEGTQAFGPYLDGSVLLRHSFHNRWYVQSFLTDHVNRHGYFTSTIKRANQAFKFPPRANSFDTELQTKVSRFQELIEQQFISQMKPVERVYAAPTTKKRPAGPLVSTTEKRTRGDTLISTLQKEHPSKILEKFETLKEQERKQVLGKLLNNANREDAMRIEIDRLLRVNNTPITAVRLLEYFGQTFARQSYVTRVLESPESVKSGHIFPRTKNFVDLSERQTDNLAYVMSELAVKIAKLLLPNDTTADKGIPTLLNAMSNNLLFKRFTLPEEKYNDKGYISWTKNPTVIAIKGAIAHLGRSDQALRVQLISLLSAYPSTWVRHFIENVGRTTIAGAIDHARAVGPGLKQKIRIPLTRNRRVGEKERFFLEWISRKENVESSPEINRDSATGKLLKTEKRYRILNRLKGYTKYVKDAAAEGPFPCYHKSTFYRRNEEIGLYDTKCEAGLCPNCHQYGTETWEMVKTCIKLFVPVTDERRSTWISSTDKFEQYFKRGGEFYQSLDRTSTCVDWCCQHALSDPMDEDFISACDDHEHTEHDETIARCDAFFRLLISQSREYVHSKNYGVDFIHETKDDNGESSFRRIIGRIVHIRGGIARVTEDDSNINVDVLWRHTKIEHKEVNELLLCDMLMKQKRNHLRHRQHLYLDRNQTYGEIQINRYSDDVCKLDYMMKLRAQVWKSDTSMFHVLMNKGTSVHVFCYRRRITVERMPPAETMSDEELENQQLGDYQMAWIDSFCSNTGQGGYETLCVEEASLRELKKLFPDVGDVVFCSDAGSGYKSSQTILGLRNSKELTGVRVRHLHFNASGEGKRSETDGHNTDIKARRKEAMKAGKPQGCTTPAKEVEAQKFSGGCPGAYPVLLEFDYESQVAMSKPWDGIQGWHDFEIHDDGDVTVWKSYKIGAGKRFKREALDKLYKKQSEGFPQATTNSEFVGFAHASPESYKPHLEQSRRKKNKDAAERTLKREGRKKIKQEAEESALHNIQEAMKERLPERCAICNKQFKAAHHMADHSCDPPPVPTGETVSPPREVEFVHPATLTISPASGRRALLGHGLVTWRTVNVLDPIIKEILEEQYEKGVANSSNRKGVLEMVEACESRVPLLLLPSINSVSGWLSNRLILAKKPPETKQKKSESEEEKKKKPTGKKSPKSVFERRQEAAVKISKDHFPLRLDASKKHLFIAKYIDIHLVIDTVVRVCTGLQFHDGCWHLMTALANRSEIDDREWILKSPLVDTDYQRVEVKRKKGGAGPYIKEFNNKYLSS
jgi:hypothetical protein